METKENKNLCHSPGTYLGSDEHKRDQKISIALELWWLWFAIILIVVSAVISVSPASNSQVINADIPSANMTENELQPAAKGTPYCEWIFTEGRNHRVCGYR